MKNPEPTLDLEALLKHQDWLRALVRVLVLDDHRAEDVVQETWLAAVKHPPRSGSVRRWLRGVARNIALRVRDREARIGRRERAAARPERLPTTHDVVEREALRRSVVEQVLELEKSLRVTVLLHYFEELPAREVARRLGISVEATRRRLRKAEAEIKRRLGARHGADWRAAVLPLLGWKAGEAAAGVSTGVLTGILTMTNTIKALIVAAVVAGAILLVRYFPQDPALPEVSNPVAGIASGEEPPRTAGDASDATRPTPVSGAGTNLSSPRSGAERAPVVQGTVWTRQGVPMAGATVLVSGAYRPGMDYSPPLAETRTDARGAFAIHDCGHSNSEIILEASAPGFYSDSKYCYPGRWVHFRLGKPGTLHGRVTAGGAPVKAAWIEVSRIGRPSLRKVCGTDARGRYRLDRLKPGLYQFCISGPGGESCWVEVRAGEQTRADFAFEKTDLVNVNGFVTTSRGETPLAGINVTLVSGLVRIPVRTDPAGRFRFDNVASKHRLHTEPTAICSGDTAYVKTGRPSRESSASGLRYRILYTPGVLVRGIVLGPDSMPVAGAKMRATAVNGYLHLTAEATDDQGRFTLTGRLGRTGDSGVKLTVFERGNRRGVFNRRLDLGPGERGDDLVLQLDQGGTVSGRIREEDGNPVGGALVHLISQVERDRNNQFTRSTMDGRYCLRNVPVGRYRLRVKVCGRPWFESPEVVDVLESMNVEGRNVALPAGAVLAGRVEDAEGRPLPDAGVRARPHRKDATRSRPAWISARMDPEGRFRFHGLVPGEYEVHACSWVQAHHASQDRIAPTGVQDLLFRLVPGPCVKGRVRFAVGGKPATTFRISLHRSWKLYSKTFRFLDTGGIFTLPGIEEGDYELEARAKKDGSLFVGRTAFRMPAGQNPPFQEVRLKRTRSFRGLVQDPDGIPQPGARITIVLEGRTLEEPLYTAETDGDGRYAVPQVQPGTYEVRASHPDWVETSRRVPVGSSTIAPLDFVLGRTGGSVQVTVVDGRNTPVQGARIHVLRPDGTFLNPDRTKYERAYLEGKRSNPDLGYEAWVESYTRTDARGILVRRFLPPGRYEVRAEARGFETGTRKVEIRAGVEATVRIDIRRTK